MKSLSNLARKIRIPKEISWYTGASIVTQVFAFIGISFVSRYLGPVNLGLYSFTLNYVAVYLSCISGLELYYTWHIAKSDDTVLQLKKFIGHKFNILSILTVISTGLAFVILPRDVALLCTVVSLPLFLHSVTAFTIYASTQGNARAYAIAQIGSSAIILVLRIVLVWSGAGLAYFVLTGLLDLLITGSLIAFHYFKDSAWALHFRQVTFPTYVDTAKLLLAIRYTIMAFIAWQLILRADQLLLATFSNAYTLGIYSAAAKIAEVPNFLAGILYMYTIPKFGTGEMPTVGSPASFFKTHRKIVYAYLGISLTIMVGILVFAPLGIRILYGSQYVESVSILRIYALSIPPMFLLYFFFSLYSSVNRYKAQAIIFGCGLLLTSVVVRVSYAYFGIHGVAGANVISYSLLVLAFAHFYNRRKNVL